MQRLRTWVKEVAYRLYDRRLVTRLPRAELPRHVGVILDGNRRWAADQGSSSAHGHRAGGAKISEFLSWCDELGIEVVTLWLLSTDNLGRSTRELTALFEIIGETVENLAAAKRWRIHLVGALDLLPAQTVARLRAAEAQSRGVDGVLVNIAVGYGGRYEVVDAVRSLLLERAKAGESAEEIAKRLSQEDISAHLYTKGQPDPELVIRTSGEQRLSGFLLWQSAHSEFYFCEAYWPSFRRIDFLRALRAYSQRHRRFGT